MLGTSLPSLGLIPLDISARNLPDELDRAAMQLAARARELLEFCDYVLRFQDQYCSADWGSAQQTLIEAGKNFGRSYWEVELTLAVEQALGGVEKMKALVGQLAAGGSGLQKFILHYVGVRNEPAQTASRFRTNTERRISDAEVEQGIESYLRHRLTGQLSLDEKHLSSILSAEQLTTDIDLLFTTIRIVQWIYANPSAFPTRTKDAADTAAIALDPFARKLHIRLRRYKAWHESQAPLHIVSDPISFFYSNPTDLLALAHAAIHRLWSASPEDSAPPANRLEQILAGVVSRLSTRSNGLAAEELAKAELNFATLPLISQLGDTAAIPKFVSIYLEYMAGARAEFLPGTLRDALLCAMTQSLTGDLLDGGSGTLYTLSSVARANQTGDESAALALLTQDTELSELQSDAFLVVAGVLAQRGDRTQDAVRIIARAAIQNPQLVPLLPLNEIFTGVRWAELAKLGASVELAICLDLYLRATGDMRAC